MTTSRRRDRVGGFEREKRHKMSAMWRNSHYQSKVFDKWSFDHRKERR